MRVIHYQHMGVGVVIAGAQRELGVTAKVLSTAVHPFGFKEDRLFRPLPVPFLGRIAYGVEWLRQLSGFDIIHSHDNYRLPEFVLRRWGGRIVQHYHDPKTSAPLYSDVPSLASVPSIIKAVPNAMWCPLPVDIGMFKPQDTARSKIVVGYCWQPTDPTKRQYIPAAEVEDAVSGTAGRACTYPLTDVMPHQSMAEYYGKLDIWVDRIGLDFYGFAAVEVAAMGIPVIAQISEDAIAYVPDCPFINVKDRGGVKDAIRLLVQDEELRKSLGQRARAFAVRVHDKFRVARLCLSRYEELLNGRP
jgi:glycosyltransferase involved in cell wall biosynthesis